MTTPSIDAGAYGMGGAIRVTSAIKAIASISMRPHFTVLTRLLIQMTIAFPQPFSKQMRKSPMLKNL